MLLCVGFADLFAVALFIFMPGSTGSEFVAGYITEYSLSVDNLFVFMIIMTHFEVPALAEDKVLYIGIVLSLVFRADFIFAGAAAIAAASWVFYILGGFLIYTAIQLALEDPDEEPDFHENAVRVLRRILPISEDYNGSRLLTRDGPRRLFTPLVIVIAVHRIHTCLHNGDQPGEGKSRYPSTGRDRLNCSGIRQERAAGT